MNIVDIILDLPQLLLNTGQTVIQFLFTEIYIPLFNINVTPFGLVTGGLLLGLLGFKLIKWLIAE